jgi:hypothetical protein
VKFSKLQKNPIFWCVRGLSVYRVRIRELSVYRVVQYIGCLCIGSVQWIKSWIFVVELMTSC